LHAQAGWRRRRPFDRIATVYLRTPVHIAASTFRHKRPCERSSSLDCPDRIQPWSKAPLIELPPCAQGGGQRGGPRSCSDRLLPRRIAIRATPADTVVRHSRRQPRFVPTLARVSTRTPPIRIRLHQLPGDGVQARQEWFQGECISKKILHGMRYARCVICAQTTRRQTRSSEQCGSICRTSRTTLPQQRAHRLRARDTARAWCGFQVTA
jgi:hypothetical protein